MTIKAKAIQTLYRAGRLSKEGVRSAVETGIISTDEYYIIIGEPFEIPVMQPEEPQTEPENTTETDETEIEENIEDETDVMEGLIEEVEPESEPESASETEEEVTEIIEKSTENIE
jgi:hypothetical protein